MFESAELGHKVDDDKFKKEAKPLREQLLTTQFDVLTAKKFPVILLVNGVDGAGKTETVQLFNEWLDPRHVRTRAFGQPTDDERTRPPMWRFWQALPPKGKLSILFGSWYAGPIHDVVFGDMKDGGPRRPSTASATSRSSFTTMARSSSSSGSTSRRRPSASACKTSSRTS
jgi:polyphosphate kinase 2 (PPK2 family)